MQKKVVIEAKAPLRIGFAGGGTDVDPYASQKGGLVFNTTIDKYAYCTIIPNGTNIMSVQSPDYGEYRSRLDNGPLPYDGDMDLMKVVVNHFEVTAGFDAYIRSDVPPGSGLGGSSTVIVAIIGAMAKWLNIKMKKYEMADLAYRLEREELGLKGGKQDQYAAVFGGFNLMTFTRSGVKVKPLKLKRGIVKELESRSLLCYTGKARESADIIESQVKNLEHGINEAAYDESKRIAIHISKALGDGDIDLAALLLNEAWMQKKKFSTKVTNTLINTLYDLAMDNGAIGGKVSGAGGGGFMYFICQPGMRENVAKVLESKGAVISEFVFDGHGVRTGGIGIGRFDPGAVVSKLKSSVDNEPI
jgi:D-glycero-alpha-D-manno-heptose-7-phosphate kinase